jgi:pimeloyl-ACP methyl ester carboxylesterase
LSALEQPGAGVPIIALHGWLDNAASFSPLAPLLDGARVVAIDLPGHGHSDHLPAAAGYHMADNPRWVMALADALGWQRFVLLGHSMGAAASAISAAAAPSRVAGLVLIDGLGPIAFTPEQELARLRQLLDRPHSTPLERPKPQRPFETLEVAVKLRQQLGHFTISSEAARIIIERGMQALDGGGYLWRHDPRLKRPGTHYYTEEQVMGMLRGVEAKTLLVSADHGAFKGWKSFERRKACIADLEHVILPGGHHLHMEQAQAVAAVINPFLARLREERV